MDFMQAGLKSGPPEQAAKGSSKQSSASQQYPDSMKNQDPLLNQLLSEPVEYQGKLFDPNSADPAQAEEARNIITMLYEKGLHPKMKGANSPQMGQAPTGPATQEGSATGQPFTPYTG